MNFKMKPFKHQQEAFDIFFENQNKSIDYTIKGREYQISNPNFMGLFFEVGCGKSKTAIDIASNLYNKGKIDGVLLVSPQGVVRQWQNEQVPQHSPLDTEGFLWQNSKAKSYKRELESFITVKRSKIKYFYVNIDRFSTTNKQVIDYFIQYLTHNRVLIIIDESTVIKNPNAKRTQCISKLAHLARYKLILTGTPITNSVFDIYSMMEFCYPSFWKCNYFIFQNRYGIFIKEKMKRMGRDSKMVETVFNRPLLPRDIVYIKKLIAEYHSPADIALMTRTSETNVQFLIDNPGHVSPYKNIDEIRDVMRKFCYIVKAADCLDLPDKSYQTIQVEMNPIQEKIYKDLAKNYFAEFDGEELDIQHKLILSLRLQQILGGHFPYKNEDLETEVKVIDGKNPKISAIKQEINEQGENSCIIWARFRAEIKLINKELQEAFPLKVIETYYGDTPIEEREDIKQRFQAGEVDILIINPQTGAMGLNLQACHINYIYSNTYSIQDRIQLEGRTHRSGQKNHVIYKDFICIKTVDLFILKALRERKDLADYFKENDIEF